MKTAEFLREIRAVDGFPRAVLTGIEAEKKSGTATFLITTDVAYTAGAAERLREICAEYLPAGMTAAVKISKLVPDAAAVRDKILSLLRGLSPAAASFLRPGDVEVAMNADGHGARFCLDFSADEKKILQTGEILDAVSAALNKTLCGSYLGAVRETEKAAPVLEAEPPAEEEEEIFVPRTFPVADFVPVDGGDKPASAVCMADCNGEQEDLTVCGKILFMQEKQTGKGKPYFVFQLSDGTARMRVTYFSKQATVEKIRALQTGDSIVCTGANELYGGALSYNAKRINRGGMPADYVIKERPMKHAPAAYHTVFPAPCGDFVQTDLFAREELPAALKAHDFVVFDLETTGLNNTAVGGVMDSIIEIGAVKIKGGRISEKFSTFVACEKKLPPEIVKITGITDDMLAGAPAVDKVIPDFYKFCDGCYLVGHNVTFDYRFIEFYAEKERYAFKQKRFDTLALGQELLRLPNYKLNTLADFYHITFNHHRAFDDALATAKIFIELVKRRGSLPEN